jgi:TM2 domain-containing membrane protein YozV/ribosomal protein L40E
MKKENQKFCQHCGSIISKDAEICPKCGVRVLEMRTPIEIDSNKSRAICLVLLIFFGALGIYRFYVGKIGTGVLQIILFASCFVFNIIAIVLLIWLLGDLLAIILGNFKDSRGNYLTKWNSGI